MGLIRPGYHRAMRDSPVIHGHLPPVLEIVAGQDFHLARYRAAGDGARRLVTVNVGVVRTGKCTHVGNRPVLLLERALATALAQIDPVNFARKIERVFEFGESECNSLRRHTQTRDLAEYGRLALRPL